jgi:high-affinity Fe2+/Pb2+ permease
VLAGIFGYRDIPTIGEAAVYLLYLVPALALMMLSAPRRAFVKQRA